MTSTNIYCMYLTVYTGNELPPFYIGYTSVKNIHAGYSGSVSSKEFKDRFRALKRTKPDQFKTRIIKTFHTKVEAQRYEHTILKAMCAHNNPLYINKHAGGSLYNHDHVTREFNVEMSNRAKLSKNYKFSDIEFQREMSNRAKSKPGYHDNQSRVASKLNANRVSAGTHNFSGESGSARVKDTISKKQARPAAILLQVMTGGIGLGSNWFRKNDAELDRMLSINYGYVT